MHMLKINQSRLRLFGLMGVGLLLICMPLLAQQATSSEQSNGGVASSNPVETESDTKKPTTTSDETTGSSLLDISTAGGMLMLPIGLCSLALCMFVFERAMSLRKGRVIPRPFVKRFVSQMQTGELSRGEASRLCKENKSPVAPSSSSPVTVTTTVVPACPPAGKMDSRTGTGSCAGRGLVAAIRMAPHSAAILVFFGGIMGVGGFPCWKNVQQQPGSVVVDEFPAVEEYPDQVLVGGPPGRWISAGLVKMAFRDKKIGGSSGAGAMAARSPGRRTGACPSRRRRSTRPRRRRLPSRRSPRLRPRRWARRCSRESKTPPARRPPTPTRSPQRSRSVR